MLSIAQRLFILVRYLGVTLAVAGTAYRLLRGTLMETLPQRMSSALLGLWAILATWPFYAIGLILLGSWLQDHLDALLRSHEGKPSWIGYRLLRARIGFTRRVIQRPFWYSNDDKIARELARANTALERSGFAPLTGLIDTPQEPTDEAIEHLRTVEALIGALGYQKAAVLSHRILEMPFPSEIAGQDTVRGLGPAGYDRGERDGNRAIAAKDVYPRRSRWLPRITITVNPI